MAPKRIIIYTKDIRRITGRSERWSRTLLNKIRLKLNKKKHELINLAEFCEYMNFKLADVIDFFND